ncbi:MAG: alpha-galactosidase [Armatimonadetes bacterium]|nr:alpha-galactosidase [Armatimonadota bacterium]
MPKTVIIGAGSGFGARLSIDILAHPELREGTIGLVDIDRESLDLSAAYVRKVVSMHGCDVKVEADTDRMKVLDGADFVVVAIAVGGPAYSGAPYYHEIAIPNRYGVSQQIGDTIGPGGLFRGWRTAPEMCAILEDMERLCPGAIMLNYTNPMAMLCWIMNEVSPVRKVGLCHSVQGTFGQLASYIGKPPVEMTHWVAGINHMSWFLDLKWRGQDAYPLLRTALDDPETYAKDTVRFEIMRHFDYFVTESTPHMSEYVPYFRKRPELLDQFGLRHRDPEPEAVRSGRWIEDSPMRKQLDGREPISLVGSHEYASFIIKSVWTDVPGRINGNVANDGCIANLPQGCCVEVPCLADRTGVRPCTVGALPSQLAALNVSNVSSQGLAVEAFLEQDRRRALQAILLDPLTAAVCSPGEIRSMFDEMSKEEAALIPWLA